MNLISLVLLTALAANAPSKKMPDGKRWTTRNLNVDVSPSYCYDNAEANCRIYGRLYTWESAQRACPLLGARWRLPTDAEWRALALRFGGVSADAADKGKGAYTALQQGGASRFEARLGGGREPDGKYARREAHGFYWTATEINAREAWNYNFGKGQPALHRQAGMGKTDAASVRCIRD